MSNQNSNGFGWSHLSAMPVTVLYALVIAAALVALALLRHFSVSVEA